MKILLTGANGSIGTELRKQNPEIVPVKVRPNDFRQVRNELIDTDVLIHAGALLHSKSLSDLVFENVFTTAKIMEYVFPSTRVIFLSSMSILGEHCDVKHGSEMSEYALSKYLAEEVVRRFPNTLSIRASTIFYGDPSKDGLSEIVSTAKHTDKAFILPCTRDFIPLPVLARRLLDLCDPKLFDFYRGERKTLNIGTGLPTCTADIGEFLTNKFGTSVEYGERGSSVCAYFPVNHKYPPVNIYKEIEDYYVCA